MVLETFPLWKQDVLDINALNLLVSLMKEDSLLQNYSIAATEAIIIPTTVLDKKSNVDINCHIPVYNSRITPRERCLAVKGSACDKVRNQELRIKRNMSLQPNSLACILSCQATFLAAPLLSVEQSGMQTCLVSYLSQAV